MTTTYPTPDRSTQTRSLVKGDDGVVDIGSAEGRLSDGRPCLAELWAQDQVTCVVVFFSRVGLDDLGSDDPCDLLEREGLVRFGPKRFCDARPFDDNAGQPMWSVNLVVGDDEHTFLAADTFKFQPYGSPA